MTQVIQTSELTFNNNVKAQVKSLMPSIAKVQKKYVSGIGNVFYFYSITGKKLGNV